MTRALTDSLGPVRRPAVEGRGARRADALTVADVASMAGENVTTALRADLKELRADMNARIDTLAGWVQSLQREIGTLRRMIGSGFTLPGVLPAVATFVLRGS